MVKLSRLELTKPGAIEALVDRLSPEMNPTEDGKGSVYIPKYKDVEVLLAAKSAQSTRAKKIKWADHTDLRKKLVSWSDRKLKSDPCFLMDSFMKKYLRDCKDSDIRKAVRQCNKDMLYDLDWIKDEMKINP